MRYQGGKTRIAKHIAPFIIGEAMAGRTTYIEPFVGSAAITHLVAPYFDKVIATDAMPDLILMWQALQNGWVPPDNLPIELWRELKTAEPSALRAFAGFGVSFGGNWFSSYAPTTTKHYYPRVPVRAAKQSITKRIKNMGNVDFQRLDYRELKNNYRIDKKTVIYADPPYNGTSGYKGAPEKFDSKLFWQEAELWQNNGAVVYVSEYNAPKRWTYFWEKETRVSMSSFKENRAVERLFTYTG